MGREIPLSRPSTSRGWPQEHGTRPAGGEDADHAVSNADALDRRLRGWPRTARARRVGGPRVSLTPQVRELAARDVRDTPMLALVDRPLLLEA